MAAPFNARLCTGCQRWNSPTIIFRPTFERTFVWLESILLNKECIICRVIGPLILDKLHVTDRDLYAASSIRVHVGSAFLLQDTHFQDHAEIDHHISEHIRCGNSLRCILYVQTQDVRTEPEPLPYQSGYWLPSPTMGVQLSLSYKSDPTLLAQVNTWNTPFFDTKLVKSWISKCKHHHEDCKNFEAALAPGFRLIDVENLCIAERSHFRSFVALSYMWNSSLGENDLQLCQGNLLHLQKPGGVDLGALPDVVADAVRLCKDLGERYLWVDRLCIVQDDSASKHAEIDAMGSVYGMASFTIVAATDPAQGIGLPGTRGRPRKPFIFNDTRHFNFEVEKVETYPHVTVDNSAWNTRAWTFQERVLSLRCLCITDFQVYLSCPGGLCQEEIGAVPMTASGWDPLSQHSLPWLVKTKRLDGYLTYVSKYMTRKLSYQTDILNAFAGVSQILSKQFRTRFFFGLPEKYFTQALLWCNAGHEARRSGVPDIPSWSWAAWLGPIHFSEPFHPLLLPIGEHDTGVLVKLYIQDFEEGLQPLAVKQTWFEEHEGSFPDDQRTDLGQYKVNKRGRMPSSSHTNYVWSECLQNPWELSRHTSLHPAACALARKYPGCLVFNTTAATLRLKKPTPDNQGNPRSHEEKSELFLHLCDEESNKIGYMTVGKQWVEQVIDIESKHSFVVLCAGLLPKFWRSRHRWSSPSSSKIYFESPWLLVVMLIQRDGGVARRLGLGYVEARLWGTVDPKWETVVLT